MGTGVKDRIAKTDWTVLASLKKMKDGEEARVLWPKLADSEARIGYRYGRLSIETIPGKVGKDGTRKPDTRGAVFFEWGMGDPAMGNEFADRIQITMPKQVEVKRESTKHGHSRRMG